MTFQVTCEYYFKEGACIPKRVHTVVVSVQHSEKINLEELRNEIMTKVSFLNLLPNESHPSFLLAVLANTFILPQVIRVVIPEKYLDQNTVFHVNPCGLFITGGPQSDAGLTGRKIIVDTYGGWGAHGGGAFSGKDFTKVDRSAAYAARWVAKSLVKAELCR